MTNFDKILLHRRNKIIISADKSAVSYDNAPTIAAMIKNMECLGYTLDRKIIFDLYALSEDDLEELAVDLLKELRVMTGADKVYRPMYPNFPGQVADATTTELFINAVMHYNSLGTWMPLYVTNEKVPLLNRGNFTVLIEGSKSEVFDIFKNLLNSKTSLSLQDKADIETVIAEMPDFYDYLPEEIPLKENVAFLAKTVLAKAATINISAFKRYFKTATDVLRFVVALSVGDISLSEPTKFKKFTRRERRFVMDLLVNCGDILEDMYRYRNEWIRIGEILHPGEWHRTKGYEKVISAFNSIRNEKKPLFLPGEAQEAIRVKDSEYAASLLKARPGELARSLDKLVRDAWNQKIVNYVVNTFREVAEQISVPVLLQVRQHFLDRNKEMPVRVFFPKGSIAKVTAIPNELPNIDSKYCQAIVRICDNAICEQLKAKEFLGNVYLDEEFKNYLVPFSQRSASEGTKNLVRGSRIKLPNDTTVARGFIWWTNTKDNQRVDIDLTGAVFDESWSYITHVSYTNLRENSIKCYHSGDITNGGNYDGQGAAEFIDFDIDKCKKYGGRYVIFQVYNYTQQPFSELTNCRFGFMARKDVNSGEIFEPSTVEMKINLTSNTCMAIPVIFDCETEEFIWCDIGSGIRTNRGGNNLESNLKGVTAACYAMTHLSKPNLYDLVLLNIKARGCLVEDRNDADIIFSNDKTAIKNETEVPIITAFDTDYFMGQLL